MKIQQTDEELMLRYKDGDKNAFEILYQRYEKPVLDFIYRMLIDATVAESLCQEAFYRVVKSKKKYKATAQFKTWLFQIALNLCRDRLRRMKHRSHLSLNKPLMAQNDGTIELQDLILDPSPGVIENFESGELGSQVKAAIASLPEEEHLVVVMKEYQGMSYSEIAEVLDCPIGTLKSHNYRAHQRLKGILSKHIGD
ncbi:MAG: sigma-70 family RNA polymerase sigma factor [Candidatus Aminicenantes bacterium]|nr:MAG: sigma-70 family RNA polymerase sigma factor [Candidatus Aminicenantes bacterium]